MLMACMGNYHDELKARGEQQKQHGKGTGAGIAGRRGLVHGWQHVQVLLVTGFLAWRIQVEGLVLCSAAGFDVGKL